jgi:centromere/kinetochore protein ZW10
MAHAVKMLDDRAFALKSSLREDLSILWASVALFDKEGSLTFTKSKVEIETAVISMSALGDLKPQVELFHESLRKLIILPRFHLKIGSLPLIETDATTVRIWGTHIDRTIKTLFIDLEQIILFLAQHLPQEFCHELSQVMIPPLCTYIREQWLDSAIPPALGDMTAFRKAIYVVQTFVDQMDSMKWNGTAALQDWVLNVPRLWLAKRKETSLDWTRNQIAMGKYNSAP